MFIEVKTFVSEFGVTLSIKNRRHAQYLSYVYRMWRRIDDKFDLEGLITACTERKIFSFKQENVKEVFKWIESLRDVNDEYERLCDYEGCETQNDHIRNMWSALNTAVCYKAGWYESIDNGDGTIHCYHFYEGFEPDFACISDDIYNQIEIVVHPW